MKTKILAITAVLCSLHTIYAFGAPEDNNYIVQKGTDRTEIKVSGDCNIVVADIAPDRMKKIYGDKVGNVVYGGSSDQLFNNKQVIPNGTKKGIEIHRDKNKRIVLSVKYAVLENTEIQIVSALYKDSLQATPDKAGYFPGNPFKISIKKGGMEGNDEATTGAGIETRLPIEQTGHNASEIEGLKDAVESLSQEVSQLKKKTKDSNKELYDILLLLIALLVVISYFLYRKNRNVLKELSMERSDLKKIIDNRKEEHNIQVAPHQTTQQKNKGKNSMTDDDIKRFVVEQIKSLQTQFASSILQPTIATNSDIDSAANPVKKEEQTTDTDNVKYHQDDNFFSLEQTNIKIFRIYSKNGEYYYTIVDDSAVREELIGMLQMFEECIVYQTTPGVAKRVEPVSDGQLRKDGNKFYVDNNNKLVVRFI